MHRALWQCTAVPITLWKGRVGTKAKPMMHAPFNLWTSKIRKLMVPLENVLFNESDYGGGDGDGVCVDGIFNTLFSSYARPLVILTLPIISTACFPLLHLSCILPYLPSSLTLSLFISSTSEVVTGGWYVRLVSAHTFSLSVYTTQFRAEPVLCWRSNYTRHSMPAKVKKQWILDPFNSANLNIRFWTDFISP